MRALVFPDRGSGDAIKAITLGSFLLLLWCLMRPYKGITGDAELYAVQAMARLHPGLATDLYLQYVSQDQFTIFSPFYAWFIARLGLPEAAFGLTLASSLGFVAGAWLLARRSSSATTALVAVGAVILIPGTYGAYSVFSYWESWLTARSVAEALVIVALSLQAYGHRITAFVVTAIAMTVHPIMALPGVLLLACLSLPLRWAIIATVGGIVGVLVIAQTAKFLAVTSGPWSLMDASWLEVVRERSQFLFPQYWALSDWSLNVRPLVFLAAYAVVLDGGARKLCIAALLVGGAGLLVAVIAGLIGPVALLVQGQAWRWVWVACFVSVLLLPSAIQQVWRYGHVGKTLAVLLLCGWMFPAASWHLMDGLAPAWEHLRSVHSNIAIDPPVISFLREVLSLKPIAITGVTLLMLVMVKMNSARLLTVLCLCFLAGTVAALPGSCDAIHDVAGKFSSFEDWRRSIPPDATVFVAPAHNSASFAWFTLERPSYLTVDQSAGVVFSRDTALEVKRRSNVLLPLQDPDWRLKSGTRPSSSGASGYVSKQPILTANILTQICGDPRLDFVVARERIGFNPVGHPRHDAWQDWNLYDCRHVRASTTAP